jgi:hypothetical protein
VCGNAALEAVVLGAVTGEMPFLKAFIASVLGIQLGF